MNWSAGRAAAVLGLGICRPARRGLGRRMIRAPLPRPRRTSTCVETGSTAGPQPVLDERRHPLLGLGGRRRDVRDGDPRRHRVERRALDGARRARRSRPPATTSTSPTPSSGGAARTAAGRPTSSSIVMTSSPDGGDTWDRVAPRLPARDDRPLPEPVGRAAPRRPRGRRVPQRRLGEPADRDRDVLALRPGHRDLLRCRPGPRRAEHRRRRRHGAGARERARRPADAERHRRRRARDRRLERERRCQRARVRRDVDRQRRDLRTSDADRSERHGQPGRSGARGDRSRPRSTSPTSGTRVSAACRRPRSRRIPRSPGADDGGLGAADHRAERPRRPGRARSPASSRRSDGASAWRRRPSLRARCPQRWSPSPTPRRRPGRARRGPPARHHGPAIAAADGRSVQERDDDRAGRRHRRRRRSAHVVGRVRSPATPGSSVLVADAARGQFYFRAANMVGPETFEAVATRRRAGPRDVARRSPSASRTTRPRSPARCSSRTEDDAGSRSPSTPASGTRNHDPSRSRSTAPSAATSSSSTAQLVLRSDAAQHGDGLVHAARDRRGLATVDGMVIVIVSPPIGTVSSWCRRPARGAPSRAASRCASPVTAHRRAGHPTPVIVELRRQDADGAGICGRAPLPHERERSRSATASTARPCDPRPGPQARASSSRRAARDRRRDDAARAHARGREPLRARRQPLADGRRVPAG